MRTPRGTRNTVIGFALVWLVVLCVTGWATWVTVNLEWSKMVAGRKDTTLKDREKEKYKLKTAMWRLDAPMMGVLRTELSRAPSEYVAFHNPERENIWAAGGSYIDPSRLWQRSPLCDAGPWQDWIELYFQVDPYGHWSSPQVPDETGPWPFDYVFKHRAEIQALRGRLTHLQSICPLPELIQQVTQAMERDRLPFQLADAEESKALAESSSWQGPLTANLDRVRATERTARHRQYRRIQASSTPPIQCVPTAQMTEFDPTIAEADSDRDSDDASLVVSPDSMPAFWLPPDGRESRKLVFVRTGYVDNNTKVFYQGFVANWDLLKAELMRGLELPNVLFPGADLEPIIGDVEIDPENSETLMTTIPARLTGVDTGTFGISSTLPTRGDAWRAAMLPLVLVWVTILSGLLASSWGLRNLLSLTERRMQFAYAVTHELRTPLTTFRLYTDMLAAGLVPDESKQEYLETLNKEAGRLSGLVEDVLEYARLENHKVRLNPINTSGDTLLNAFAQDLKTRCSNAGIEAQMKNDIPENQSLRTDVDLVHQITNVLVNNACRHAAPKNGSSPHNGEAKVLLHLSADNGHVHVNVIDTGPGIERLDARDIFKPFRRGRNADAKAQSGVGLGLALARNWATLLDGRLELAARHHPTYGGAHFRLTIPSKLDA